MNGTTSFVAASLDISEKKRVWSDEIKMTKHNNGVVTGFIVSFAAAET